MRLSVVCTGIAVQLAAGATAHALDGHRGITQYAQTRFDAQHGLAHNLVNSMAQTPDGYLWAGSEEGLTRYDGVTFTTFDHRKTEGIPSNTFSALAVDHEGTLWAGTRDHGMLRLIDGEFSAVIWDRGAEANAQVRALTVGPDGDIWIGLHDRGVVRLRGTTVVGTVTVRDGLPSDDIRSILVARDGSMWIATFRGLARWRAGQVLHGPAALDGVAIDEVAQDARGDLWCATANGLAHVRGDAVDWVGADRLPSLRIRQVVFDRDGNLWIGTGAGAARMTPDGHIDLLPQPVGMVLELFEDSEGDMWIGTEGGLDRLRDGDVIPVGAPQGASSDIMMTVRSDHTGAMWLAGDTGLFRIAPGAATATRIAGDHGMMFGIYPDHRGDVWFGARDGSVGRWHDGKFAWLGRRSWERVRSFAETADTMWLGTDNGLFRMRGDELDDAESVLAGIAVSAVTPDAADGLWLATESGVMRWRDGGFVAIPPGGPPSNTSATTIQFDADGTMWVTTEGAGLWRLRNGKWFGFTSKKDGLFDDLVWRVLDDRLGNFWLSSNRGISMISRQQLEDRADGLRGPVDYVLYGEGDGMPSRECDGSMDPAGWRSPDGRLWFPTVKGTVVIDPAHLHHTPPADALVDSVRVDGQRHRAGALDLVPGVSRLEIVYTAPALRNPDRLRFRYQLVGFDATWNDAGAQRVAQYTNLAPGTYRFVVQAGRDGAWGRSGELEITLRPHFYQTRAFTVLAIALAILAVVAVPLLRIRQLRARERELAERIREAIRELAEREQKLRDMQAQLVEASRQAGRSDVATTVLHNVGNVLNSVNVSASLIHDIVGRFKTGGLSRVAALITEHRDDLAQFFHDDRRGQKLPEYFVQLQEVLERDKSAALAEIEALMRNLDHIKIVVSSQQAHVKNGGASEVFEIRQLLDDAIKLAPGSRIADAIEIVREVDDLPPVRLDRHKALQILVNLLANARDAVLTRPGPRRIAVSARRGAPGQFEILVEDNGCGIAQVNVDNIFQLGFTTKPEGNGLGLHYSACAALELHGKLMAESAGIDRGATFKLVLPLEAAVAAAA